ncbi:MAG: hypothetical protein ACFB21_03435 [Opitutales bacterium]
MKATHLTLLLLAPALAYGQSVSVADNEIGASFFGALVAGVIIALAFQLVLTGLAVAFGISAVGNIEKQAKKDKQKAEKSGKDSGGSSVGPATITVGIGFWSALSASIAIFGAVWIAVSAILPLTTLTAVACGLGIWATAIIVLAWMDSRAISTFSGAVTNAAISGLRGISHGVSGLMGKSQAKQAEQIIEHSADHVVDRIRDEVRANFDGQRFEEKLEHYIHTLEPQRFDAAMLRSELEAILDEIEIEEDYDGDEDGLKRKLIVDVASRQPRFSKKDVSQVKEALRGSRSRARDIKAIKDSDERPADKGFHVMERFAPQDDADARAARERVERYLRETGRDELDPDRIKDDIDAIVAEPKASGDVVRNRAAQIDRGTLVAALETRSDIDHDRAERIVQSAEKALAFVQQKAGNAQEKSQGHAAIAKERAGRVREQGRAQPARARMKKDQAEVEIARRINAMERPELNYAQLKRDFRVIMNDPKQTPDVLRERLEQCDRGTVVALLASAPGVSQEQAEQIVAKYDETRAESIQRLEKVQTETRRRVAAARDEAIHQAEVARRSAATAAWWLTGTAVISGGSAVAAALLAIA